jgi:hypothetical protein
MTSGAAQAHGVSAEDARLLASLIGAGFALMGWQLAHHVAPPAPVTEDLRAWTLQMRRGQHLVHA